ILHEEPVPLARAAADCPIPLRWLIERCLAKEPVERFASTRDLAGDLRRIRDHVSTSGVGISVEASVRRPGRTGVALAIGAVAFWLSPGRGSSRCSSEGPLELHLGGCRSWGARCAR